MKPSQTEMRREYQKWYSEFWSNQTTWCAGWPRPSGHWWRGMMLDRINAARAAHNLPALSENAMLTQAAHDHAADLSRNPALIDTGRWHDGSDGSDIGTRITRAGYRGARWLENVGWGFGGDESRMFDWWMASPVHRAAILSPDVTEAGAAVVNAPGSVWGFYFVVIFGRPLAQPVKRPCPCCGRGY